jgi:hypothetical protein
MTPPDAPPDRLATLALRKQQLRIRIARDRLALYEDLDTLTRPWRGDNLLAGGLRLLRSPWLLAGLGIWIVSGRGRLGSLLLAGWRFRHVLRRGLAWLKRP